MLVNLLQQIANSSQHQMIALLGAGCASATEAIAKISHYYNITQVNTNLILLQSIYMPLPYRSHAHPHPMS